MDCLNLAYDIEDEVRRKAPSASGSAVATKRANPGFGGQGSGDTILNY